MVAILGLDAWQQGFFVIMNNIMCVIYNLGNKHGRRQTFSLGGGKGQGMGGQILAMK
jgi:hypothetical protein